MAIITYEIDTNRKYDNNILLIIAKESDDFSILKKLADCPLESVRKVVAERIPFPEVLKKLSSDASADVRMAVATNKHTPSSVLSLLAKDDVYRVYVEVAKNPNTRTEDLDYMLKNYIYDCRWEIQRAIFNHPNASGGARWSIKEEEKRIREDINPYFRI